MIDYSAIEAELKTALSTVTKFKTVETGHIRENVAVGQMPALDISATGHTYDYYDRDARYKVDIFAVVRKSGFDRADNANEFKELIENVCTILETLTGTSFSVIRDIKTDIQETESGNSSVVRIGAVQFSTWA